jgi:hypothetical protein
MQVYADMIINHNSGGDRAGQNPIVTSEKPWQMLLFRLNLLVEFYSKRDF